MNVTQDKKLADIVIGDLMISSEKVAHVQLHNPLEHALLILVNSGYSAIPVLDSSYKLHGTIDKTQILNKAMGLKQFEMEALSNIRVQEAMNTDIPRLDVTDTFMEGMKVVINYPFVCVADDDDYLEGLLTRRVILKQLKRDYYTTKSTSE